MDARRTPPNEVPRARSVALALAFSAFVGCGAPDEPPGRSVEGPDPAVPAASLASGGALPLPPEPSAASEPEPEGPAPADLEPGQGHELASIAMRNFVYIAPDYQSTRLGYLRAGALVPRAAEPAGFKRCKGGFYRIHPRGYVCVGTGATLDVAHPVALAAVRGPRRGEPFPYDYVVSRSPPPHLYVHLPTPEEQRTVEGRPLGARGMNAWIVQEIGRTIGDADPISPFLESGRDLPKPAGAEEKVRFPAHRGRAKARSAFGLMASFDWTGRRFGLTTELDLVPIDRTRPAHLSELRGVVFKAPGVPAFVMHQGLRALRSDDEGKLRPAEYVPFRSGWVLTGRASSGGEHRVEGKPGEALAAYLETTEGVWLASSSLRIGRLGQDLWGHAKRGKRWIDISIELQMLVAYEGNSPVFATLVSTGRGGLSDPETTGATVQGTFFVQSKHVTATMDGDPASEAAFELHDVPYVQYFHQNYAIHGAYWHDEFGKARSNGCVNVSPADAAWLFEFTDPPVPAAWHGAMTPAGGTLVYVHP
ncbi:L,D-transpeptidase family protein [Polyangium sp. 6x1]|uniref:L,D-transpeptidase n=1 Tax=Polyangium sp. 6x1 TaxID=3042689 RepID=UPI0024826682|nr:L,D-transpeptidase family protein [Polyangium sp. 6x1]MDI1446649.1 L,D-transpeptidase family protein [Polyangium sp. 6x1]